MRLTTGTTCYTGSTNADEWIMKEAITYTAHAPIGQGARSSVCAFVRCLGSRKCLELGARITAVCDTSIGRYGVWGSDAWYIVLPSSG